MADQATIAFTDGASKGNPGPGGWGAVVSLPDSTVLELGGGDRRTTNNRMEMQAAVGVLELLANRPGPLTILTDSKYLVQGITSWIHGWRRKGWKTASGGEVLNRDLWEELDRLRGERDGAVSWQHVAGHRGIPGNERADRIASDFAAGKQPELYAGPLSDYGHDLSVRSVSKVGPKGGGGGGRSGGRSGGGRSGGSRSGGSRKGRPYSYLSEVDGVVKRHRSWPECEKRVKGRRARFKKAMSPADERSILAGWGYSLSDVKK